MKLVKRNQKLHNPDSTLLIGDVKEGDIVKEVSEPRCTTKIILVIL